MRNALLAALPASLLFAAGAAASTQVDYALSLIPAEHRFVVTARVLDPQSQTLGLQSVGMDVVGSGGVQVLASSVWAPAWTEAELGSMLFFNKGFFIDRNDGIAGVGIGGSQPIYNQASTVIAGHNSVIEGVGLHAVSESNGDFTAGTCSCPPVVADGDYAGAGVLDVLPNMTQTMLLPDALPEPTFEGALYSPTVPTQIWGHTFVLPGATATRESIDFAGLTVQGSLTIDSDDDTLASITNHVEIAPGSQLDLTDQPMIVDYTGATPVATIQSALADGRITSSLLGAHARLGVVDTADRPVPEFVGNPVDGSSVLLRLTLPGDTNLDATVDFTDLLNMAQAYGTAESRWAFGDFDGNGQVDFDDLLDLAQHYQSADITATGLPETFARDFARAFALVPEPSSIAALAALLTCARPIVSRVRRA